MNARDAALRGEDAAKEVFQAACLAAVAAYERQLGISWAEPRAWDKLRPDEKALASGQVKAVLTVLAAAMADPQAVLDAADEEAAADEVGSG